MGLIKLCLLKLQNKNFLALYLLAFLASGCEVANAPGQAGGSLGSGSGETLETQLGIPHGEGSGQGSPGDTFLIGGDGTPIEGPLRLFQVDGNQENQSVDASSKLSVLEVAPTAGVKIPYGQSFQNIQKATDLSSDFSLQVATGSSLSLNVLPCDLAGGCDGPMKSIVARNPKNSVATAYSRLMLPFESIDATHFGLVSTVQLQHIVNAASPTPASAISMHLEDGRMALLMKCLSREADDNDECQMWVRRDACLLDKDNCDVNGDAFVFVGSLKKLNLRNRTQLKMTFNVAANASGAGTLRVQAMGSVDEIVWRWSPAFGAIVRKADENSALGAFAVGTLSGSDGAIRMDNITLRHLEPMLANEELVLRSCAETLLEIENSLEYSRLEKAIRFANCLILGRATPSQGYINNLVAQVRNPAKKINMREVISNLLDEPALNARYGVNAMSNAQFVQFAHQLLLQVNPNMQSDGIKNRIKALNVAKNKSAKALKDARLAYLNFIVDADGFRNRHRDVLLLGK